MDCTASKACLPYFKAAIVPAPITTSFSSKRVTFLSTSCHGAADAIAYATFENSIGIEATKAAYNNSHASAI